VFKSGNSQAVRIRREFRIDSDTVEIFRRGDEIVLRKPKKGLGAVFHLLASLPDDFFAEGRQQPKMQKRKRMF
jgi:antitoxin VapB